MSRITSKTPLHAIKHAVYDDFDVRITDADAREIRQSRRRNTSVWNDKRYINCALDARITRIEPGYIYGRAGERYSSQEWNAS